MTRVIWLSFHPHIQSRGPWDTGMLEHLFDGDLWDTGHSFTHVETDHIRQLEGAHWVTHPEAHHGIDVLP